MPGPKSDKLWSQAIRMAALREMEDPETPGEMRKRLNIIADNLVRAAVAGDINAMKEIGDRLDGRPKQESDTNVNLAGSLELVKRIAR
jgi:hypothetical protein